MIPFLFFGLLAIAIALEIISLKKSLDHVTLSYDFDMKMAEPGETITLSYQVSNTGRFPIFYLGLSFSFGEGVTICEDQKWLDRHMGRSFTGVNVSRSLSLMPHSSIKGRFKICLNKRGVYRLGRNYLESGDLFGLSSSVSSSEGDKTIVCTAALAESDPEIEVLGGFLGNISVRRFIMEDPSLLVGYREYTGFEPMKKISWTQTAKTNRLMVKLNDYTLDTDVAVAVNLERTYASTNDLEKVFELARTACEQLEQMRIPYAFLSNGDLRDLPQGYGRGHLGAILKSIGLSGAACYTGFDALIDKCIAANRNNRSYILVTPYLDDAGLSSLRRLQSVSDHKVCVIYGGKDRVKEIAG